MPQQCPGAEYAAPKDLNKLPSWSEVQDATLRLLFGENVWARFQTAGAPVSVTGPRTFTGSISTPRSVCLLKAFHRLAASCSFGLVNTMSSMQWISVIFCRCPENADFMMTQGGTVS